MAIATKDGVRAQVPSAARELIHAFNERKLLVWASALSWQIATAIVPFLLFGLGLIGFLSLDSVWSDIAKNIKPQMSAPAFKVVDGTANKVLHQKDLFWVTLGFALAIWEVSGGMRAIMGGLNSIYGLSEHRSWFERMRRSVVLALVGSALVLGALAVVWLGPSLYGDVGQPLGAIFLVLRWLIAGLMLGVATAMTVRYAPDGYQPAHWVTIGTSIVVATWIVTSVLFGVYIRLIASYGSIYGNLATIVILFAYIYVSGTVFFAGAQVDAMIRERVEGNRRGH